jgi:hypothetical protein
MRLSSSLSELQPIIRFNIIAQVPEQPQQAAVRPVGARLDCSHRDIQARRDLALRQPAEVLHAN